MRFRGQPYILTLLLCLSPVRILVSGLAPAAMLFYVKRVTRRELQTLLLFFGASLLPFAFSNNSSLLNYAVSLTFLSPILLIVFFGKSIASQIDPSKLDKITKLFFNILLINGAIGVVQYIIYQNDDAAIGFYGRSGLQNHGLAILYTFAAVYFYCQKRKPLNILKILLSVIYFINCSYGVGMVSVIISAVIALVLISKSKLKFTVTVFGLTLLLICGLYLINKSAFMYNINTLTIFGDSIASIISGDNTQSSLIPRKLVAWLNYFHMISENLSILITGVGGGNYNSRAAFMLNGDYTSVSFIPVSISQWHQMYIMPLWSKEILSEAYQDGSMNQPFSNFLSILAEYGIFGFTLFILGLMKIRTFLIKRIPKSHTKEINAFNFIFIFMLAEGMLDNMFEYAEIIFPFFILICWISSKYTLTRTLSSKNQLSIRFQQFQAQSKLVGYAPSPNNMKGN